MRKRYSKSTTKWKFSSIRLSLTPLFWNQIGKCVNPIRYFYISSTASSLSPTFTTKEATVREWNRVHFTMHTPKSYSTKPNHMQSHSRYYVSLLYYIFNLINFKLFFFTNICWEWILILTQFYKTDL